VALCATCGAKLTETDRFCPACEQPNMAGKLRPRFKSSLDEVNSLDLIVEPPPPPPVGTPLCPRCAHPGDMTDAYCRACGMSMAKAPRYGIDAGHGVWTIPGPFGSVYKPLRRRTTILRVTIMLAIAVSAALLVLHVIVVAGFFPILPKVPGATTQWIDWIGRAQVELAVVILAMCLVANWWTSRAYRNLEPMQIIGRRVPVGLARIAWLIPLLNLWLSKVVLDDLWRSSDGSVGARSASWRRLPSPLASHVGWVGVIGATLLIPLSVLTLPDDLNANLTEFRPSMVMGVAGYSLLLLGLGVLVGLVDQISDRQQARVDRLGTAPAAPPVPATDHRSPSAPADETESAHVDRNAGLKHVSPTAPVWGTY
jgi:hypothetical protein